MLSYQNFGKNSISLIQDLLRYPGHICSANKVISPHTLTLFLQLESPTGLTSQVSYQGLAAIPGDEAVGGRIQVFYPLAAIDKIEDLAKYLPNKPSPLGHLIRPMTRFLENGQVEVGLGWEMSYQAIAEPLGPLRHLLRLTEETIQEVVKNRKKEEENESK